MRFLLAAALALAACAGEVPLRATAAERPPKAALCCFEARFEGWAALACFAGDSACSWGLRRARTYGSLAGVKSLGLCRHLR